MKRFSLLFLLAPLMGAANDNMPVVEWSVIRTDSVSHTERLRIHSERPFTRVAFTRFGTPIKAVVPGDTAMELLPGYYAVESPRFLQGGTVEADIVLPWRRFPTICWIPEGFHLVDTAGEPVKVEVKRRIADSLFFVEPADAGKIYADNARMKAEMTPNADPYALIPQFRKVTLEKGTSILPEKASWKQNKKLKGEAYRIRIRKGKATVESSAEGKTLAMERYAALAARSGGKRVADATIEDEPTYSYRGVMIDVARNFQKPEEIRRVIDLLAAYGFNKLHFHIADDEAWRVEIAGLPELTEVASRRGYTTDESDCLLQIYTGDGSPESDNTANGYYTREQFKDLLRYARSRGISVIPEIESPGHARAARVAMEKRFRATGDDSYRLVEPGDTSVYTSAQEFHDNALNPALESTYRFLGKVYGELKNMYDEAGVPLEAIHIGGDEVAAGAWDGSAAVRRLMAEQGLKDQGDVHAWFVRRINKEMQRLGVPIAGWQEIAIGHGADYEAEVAPNVYMTNCWHYSSQADDSATRHALEGGYPVVISNVDYFYLDQMPLYDPQERGLNWGGTPVDELRTLHGYPKDLVETRPGDKGRILGLSGQLFAETIRGRENLEDFLLPKMTGLAERAWNGDRVTYSDGRFLQQIAATEIPLWDEGGCSYRLRLPGIRISEAGTDGAVRTVDFNTTYPLGGDGAFRIRYTLDGTEPTATSALYDGEPIALPADCRMVKAAVFHRDKRSKTARATL